MNIKASIFLLIFILLDIILIGFFGFMYDKINKRHYFDNKYKNNIFDMLRLSFYLSIAPILFIYFSIKEKNIYSFSFGILFFIILIGMLIVGHFMIIIK